MVTKLNVNIRAMLVNCEELAKDESNYFRMGKYIKSLDAMINDLKQYEDSSNAQKIENYIERLTTLKTLINYSKTTKFSSKKDTSDSSLVDVVDDAIKEMHQLKSVQDYSNIRKDLLNDDIIRHRKPANQTENNLEGMTEAVRFYNDTQEKITEHMLALTRNLKEQTQIANTIIKKDTDTVSRSSNMADRNINSLHKEAEKLEDHSRNAWKCWLWMMIAFVVVVFIGMVLFMKIVKKKT